MATVLGKQVSAYNDSLIAASREAVECWDKHPVIQEMILLAPGLVAAFQAMAARPELRTDRGMRDDFIVVCRDMLENLTTVTRYAAKLREHGFELVGLAELDEAMIELRFVTADMLEAGGLEANTATPSETHEACTEAHCEEMPPPQSWFDEDFSSLRGPVAK